MSVFLGLVHSYLALNKLVFSIFKVRAMFCIEPQTYT